MKRLIGLILICLISTFTTAQNFSPNKIGNKWIYKMGNQIFTDEITENNIKFEGKTYFKNLRSYSWGTTDESYYRIDNDGTIYYLDTKSNLESIEIIGKPKINNTWISSDKAWKYTVVDVAAEFRTPLQTFKDCLIIKAEQLTNRDKEKLQVYFNYYAKDVGYLGSKVDGEIITYIEKWNLK